MKRSITERTSILFFEAVFVALILLSMCVGCASVPAAPAPWALVPMPAPKECMTIFCTPNFDELTGTVVGIECQKVTCEQRAEFEARLPDGWKRF